MMTLRFSGIGPLRAHPKLCAAAILLVALAEPTCAFPWFGWKGSSHKPAHVDDELSGPNAADARRNTPLHLNAAHK